MAKKDEKGGPRNIDPKKRVAIAERNENSGPQGMRQAAITGRFLKISLRGK
jgi:hypothetical protein